MTEAPRRGRLALMGSGSNCGHGDCFELDPTAGRTCPVSACRVRLEES